MKPSKVLFNQQPLVIPVETASIFGLNEAIIIQQIHYWTTSENNKNIREGHKWVYNSYNKWNEQFPFWSVSTVKRTINKLEKAGILISGNFNRAGFDKTKWYRLNYEKIDKRVTNDEVKLNQGCGQNEPMDQVKLNQPIPETTHRVQTKTTALVPETIELPFSLIQKKNIENTVQDTGVKVSDREQKKAVRKKENTFSAQSEGELNRSAKFSEKRKPIGGVPRKNDLEYDLLNAMMTVARLDCFRIWTCSCNDKDNMDLYNITDYDYWHSVAYHIHHGKYDRKNKINILKSLPDIIPLDIPHKRKLIWSINIILSGTYGIQIEDKYKKPIEKKPEPVSENHINTEENSLEYFYSVFPEAERIN